MMSRLSLLSVIVAVWAGGCTAVNMIECQDAQTLGSGMSAASVGMTYGPDIGNLYRDSTWTLGNALSMPYAQGRLELALGPTTDLGVSAWTVSTPYIFFGIIAGHVETIDFGLKVGLKQVIVGREGAHKVALSLSGLGYAARWVLDRHIFFDSTTVAGEYSCLGVMPGVCYTYAYDHSGVSLGARATILRSSETFTGGPDYGEGPLVKSVNDTRVFYAPFVGWATGDRNRFFVEANAVIATNPSTGRLEAMPFIGCMARIGL